MLALLLKEELSLLQQTLHLEVRILQIRAERRVLLASVWESNHVKPPGHLCYSK